MPTAHKPRTYTIVHDNLNEPTPGSRGYERPTFSDLDSAKEALANLPADSHPILFPCAPVDVRIETTPRVILGPIKTRTKKPSAPKKKLATPTTKPSATPAA